MERIWAYSDLQLWGPMVGEGGIKALQEATRCKKKMVKAYLSEGKRILEQTRMSL
jgi:hypothetical protein